MQFEIACVKESNVRIIFDLEVTTVVGDKSLKENRIFTEALKGHR